MARAAWRPFADRPHHQRLAAAHVAGGEHLVDAGAVVVDVGLDIAARVGSTSLASRPSCTGDTKPMASSTRSAFSLELRAGDLLHLVVDGHAMQLLHDAVLAREPPGHGSRSRDRRSAAG